MLNQFKFGVETVYRLTRRYIQCKKKQRTFYFRFIAIMRKYEVAQSRGNLVALDSLREFHPRVQS